ncbi:MULTISPECIES: class I SAM-dependent methyltransferase [Actinomycetes]|uniref:class I SAM-dependent methyltransferase n=1 Tax=Actinomycetes TaxID=1760 RepID=UPI0020969BE0|nr:class I SAM-dependent methyltransferase [Pseudonocardia sp. McavD-2-B]MCO7196832.1 methyltransferase domain-containing protein [Pseudonocardia sp. McavD-2-B]
MTDGGARQERASELFDKVASAYAGHRPIYPAQVYERIADALATPLDEVFAADIGAGTGIATAVLHACCASVVAVDPADNMLAQLREALPGVDTVQSSGDKLPFSDDSFDLVTYAQALHWTDPQRSVPEAMRVLRPGGRLAVWWNVPDFTVGWVSEQRDRLRQAAPRYHGFAGSDLGERLGEAPFGLVAEHHSFRWTRPSSPDRHVANLATQSYVVAMPDDERERFLADEVRSLRATFPDGGLDEPYVTALTIAAHPD